MAGGLFGINQIAIDGVVESLQNEVLAGVTTAGQFLIGFVLVYFVAKRLIKPGLKRVLQTRQVNPTVVSLTMSVSEAVSVVVAVAAASTLAGFGVVMSAFATLSSAIALAVGFAAQDLIGNFVSGVFILRDEPFHVGDWIEWDGMKGVVREVELRTTKIETFDNELITVPNQELANNPVVNPVANDELRISFMFGISYDDDIEQAKQVILAGAQKTPGVSNTPEPAVRLTELGDSYVGLVGTAWIDNPTHSEYVRVRSDFVQRVKEGFDAEGISIPYPFTEVTGELSIEETQAPAVSSGRDPTVND
ncbi:mechanosensitive ion channel family protein [Halocatena halophila]|uniref:mechanosensitive ion channel family protein n=1 Tax=Halocatena halophila TaxID=2814576 RepID=UPI002ED302EC